MKKLTKEQRLERADKILDALYAVREANQVNQLVTYTPYYRGSPKNKTRRQLELLADAMSDRAAKMLIKAFGGTLDGKKIPKKRDPIL
jgi:hypothetical protein